MVWEGDDWYAPKRLYREGSLATAVAGKDDEWMPIRTGTVRRIQRCGNQVPCEDAASQGRARRTRMVVGRPVRIWKD